MSFVSRADGAPSARALAVVVTVAAVVVATTACNWKPATSLVKVQSIEPNTGAAGTATTFRIIGSGFESGATVMIGGHVANVIVVNDATIMGTTLPMGEGVADVIVKNPDGGQGTLFNGFTFVK